MRPSLCRCRTHPSRQCAAQIRKLVGEVHTLLNPERKGKRRQEAVDRQWDNALRALGSGSQVKRQRAHQDYALDLSEPMAYSLVLGVSALTGNNNN
jgi:hypothetical protein